MTEQDIALRLTTIGYNTLQAYGWILIAFLAMRLLTNKTISSAKHVALVKDFKIEILGVVLLGVGMFIHREFWSQWRYAQLEYGIEAAKVVADYGGYMVWAIITQTIGKIFILKKFLAVWFNGYWFLSGSAIAIFIYFVGYNRYELSQNVINSFVVDLFLKASP